MTSGNELRCQRPTGIYFPMFPVPEQISLFFDDLLLNNSIPKVEQAYDRLGWGTKPNIIIPNQANPTPHENAHYKAEPAQPAQK